MDRGLLCSVVDLGEDELDEVIAELEAASVLEPWGTDVWRFRHELLREVAAELAPPSVRRGLHARVADALSRAAGGEPDWRLVAGHYERAERFDEAAAAYQQASAAARRRGALAEARTYLSLTLAQLDRSPPGPDRDRREMAARLERGFLATAGEGAPSLRVRGGLRAVPAAGSDRSSRRRRVRDVDRAGGLLRHTSRPASDRSGTRVIAGGARAGPAAVPPGDRGEIRGGDVAARRVRCRRRLSRGGHSRNGRNGPATRLRHCGFSRTTRP